MGGDHGPHVTVPAALEFQARQPDVAIVLVGQPTPLERELATLGAKTGERLRIMARAKSWRWTKPSPLPCG